MCMIFRVLFPLCPSFISMIYLWQLIQPPCFASGRPFKIFTLVGVNAWLFRHLGLECLIIYSVKKHKAFLFMHQIFFDRFALSVNQDSWQKCFYCREMILKFVFTSRFCIKHLNATTLLYVNFSIDLKAWTLMSHRDWVRWCLCVLYFMFIVYLLYLLWILWTTETRD